MYANIQNRNGETSLKKPGILPVIGIGTVGFFIWAAFFNIDQTVRAQGQIIPGARTQIIQSVDGGAISAINVQEGDQVKRGQVVAVLEMDRARASYNESQARIAALRSGIDRTHAESTGSTPIFSKTLNGYPDVRNAQQALFEQRKNSLEEGLAAQQESLNLAEDELRINQNLFATGDLSKVELLRARRQVNEIKARMAEMRSKYKQESRAEAAKLEEEFATQRHRQEDKLNVLEHTELRASLDGVVKYLRVNTVGGVLRPGDELMQISPSDGELLLEVKINPTDIGLLGIGLPVNLRFDAFDYTIYGSLSGELVYLSSDTMIEPSPGSQQQPFYRGRIRLYRDAAHRNPKLDIKALKQGMTVTADIRVGERSVLLYLAKPIARAFSGAMRER
jgi:membrane fusion protein, adhesin transport system